MKKIYGLFNLTSLGRLASDTDCWSACNGNIVKDDEMGEVIQLQGDQRKDVYDFLTKPKPPKELVKAAEEEDSFKKLRGYGMAMKVKVKVRLLFYLSYICIPDYSTGPRILSLSPYLVPVLSFLPV